MARRLPRKDVVIVGLGWTGSILAYELARTGLEVVAIERGPWRDTASDFNIGTAADELRYAVRHDVFLRPKQETLTMRNNPSQTALPIRKWGSFLPGNGVGGAGVHWNGQTWRFLPNDFRIRSHMTERYGEGIMPEGNHIQDWPVSYEELEPYYDKFEYVAGISGKAGNIKGAKQAGGNPFEGAAQRDYPTPPMKQGYAQELFAKAASGLGLHPFPRPSANISHRLHQSLRLRHGAVHLLRILRTFRLRQLFEGQPADLRAAGADPRADIRGANRLRSDQGQSVEGRQDRHRRHLCRSATARNGSSRPTSCWSAPTACSMCACCCCRASASRTIPQTNDGVVGRNYAYQTGSGSTAFFEDAQVQSVRRGRFARRGA